MPLINSHGTKLKVIEKFVSGVITIGTKHAFMGIELGKKNPPFIFKMTKN